MSIIVQNLGNDKDFFTFSLKKIWQFFPFFCKKKTVPMDFETVYNIWLFHFSGYYIQVTDFRRRHMITPAAASASTADKSWDTARGVPGSFS